MTLTWSHPTTSSLLKMGTSQGPHCLDVSRVLRFLLTSHPTATSCSWSFRPITPCLAEDSTSPIAVSDTLIHVFNLFPPSAEFTCFNFKHVVPKGIFFFEQSVVIMKDRVRLSSSPVLYEALFSFSLHTLVPLFSLLANANRLHHKRS